jgi:hypothetical protein
VTAAEKTLGKTVGGSLAVVLLPCPKAVTFSRGPDSPMAKHQVPRSALPHDALEALGRGVPVVLTGCPAARGSRWPTLRVLVTLGRRRRIYTRTVEWYLERHPLKVAAFLHLRG